jgi:hypothetical protein
MRESTGGADSLVEVILTGGPAHLSAADRCHRVPSHQTKIKILHRGGYEHFESVDERAPTAGSIREYRWTMRTRIAE